MNCLYHLLNPRRIQKCQLLWNPLILFSWCVSTLWGNFGKLRGKRPWSALNPRELAWPERALSFAKECVAPWCQRTTRSTSKKVSWRCVKLAWRNHEIQRRRQLAESASRSLCTPSFLWIFLKVLVCHHCARNVKKPSGQLSARPNLSRESWPSMKIFQRSTEQRAWSPTGCFRDILHWDRQQSCKKCMAFVDVVLGWPIPVRTWLNGSELCKFDDNPLDQVCRHLSHPSSVTVLSAKPPESWRSHLAGEDDQVAIAWTCGTNTFFAFCRVYPIVFVFCFSQEHPCFCMLGAFFATWLRIFGVVSHSCPFFSRARAWAASGEAS